MVKKKQKREWVVYPEIELTVDDVIEHLKNKSNKMEEKNEVPVVDEITAEVNAEVSAEATAEGISAQELLDLAETMDLTDEQKREIFIENLKKSVQRQKPTTRLGSKVLKTSATYKKERERKNKEQRASRKINR